MNGQGRPPRTLRGSVLRTVALLAACSTFLSAARCGEAVRPASFRIRLEWGGGAARTWRGSLRAAGGTVAAPQILGIDPDAPGSMFVADGRLIVASPTPRTYDGVDVDVTLPADGRLTVELGDDRETETVEIPVAALRGEGRHAALDDTGNRLSVHRAPGDALRVDVRRASLIFRTGETFEFRLRPHQLGLAPATPLRLAASLVDARSRRGVWSDLTELTAAEDDDAWPELPVSLPLPEVEGVYDLVLELSRHSLSTRLGPASLVTRRKVQLVVLSTQPPVRPDLGRTPEWPTLAEIDPTSPGWWERWKTSTLPAALRRGPLGNVATSTLRHPSGPLTQLPPGDGEELAWHAYPLPVARPGTPHLIEVEYPADVPQSLGVSLVEPNAVGAVAPLGVDGGVYVDEASVAPSPQRRVHRMVVWPRTASPLLLVVNRRRDAPAVYGKLRLLGTRGATIAALTRQPSTVDALPQFPQPDARAEGRMLAAYFDRPLFAENFSAGTAADAEAPDAPRALDDWTTYYDGARRLTDYLAWCGLNGAMVVVASDGGAIYPSARLQPTPRYEDGVHFAAGQDPMRKDVLELLLRMFDREGLRLIPTIDFNATLPELEAWKRTDDAEGLTPVGFVDGRWTATDAASGVWPRYNPLDPRVAAAMTDVVAELVERYGSHASLDGIGIQLSATGAAQLPGLEWCLDAATLRRFAAATETKLPVGLADAALAQRVLEDHREAWVRWRTDALSRHYEGLRTLLEARERPLRLHLATAHSWERPDLKRRLRPTLPTTEQAEPSLVGFGLDVRRLSEQRGITWLRPYYAAPLDDLAARGPSLELNGSATLDALAAAQMRPGSLVFHEPQGTHLPSFGRWSPFQPALLQLAAQPVPTGDGVRRLLARQLADLDAVATFHGGWTLPLGAEGDLRRFAAVVRALPAEKFAELSVANSPVRIRTLSRDDRTYVYVVNPTAWPTTVTFDVESRNAAWRTFGGEKNTTAAATLVDGRRRWQATLEPYDVVGGVFLQADVGLSQPAAAVGSDVAEALRARIQQLWARAGKLQRNDGPAGPKNAGFETAANSGSPPIAHWQLSPGTAARLVADSPRSGRQCALIIAPQGGGSLVSEPIKAGAGGRLTVGVWLRSAGAAQPAMRLSIEGRHGDRPYYRFAAIGRAPDLEPLSTTAWRQYVFPISDLPTQGLGDVRVRLEWLEAGTVFVDDVTVADAEFSAAERLELSKTITLAEYRLQRGELHACAEMLDGYWPRFLMKYVPSEPTNVAAAAPIKTPAAAPAIETPKHEAAAGMRERLRRALPSFLR